MARTTIVQTLSIDPETFDDNAEAVSPAELVDRSSIVCFYKLKQGATFQIILCPFYLSNDPLPSLNILATSELYLFLFSSWGNNAFISYKT